ncbi:MAG: hypothetical protein JWP11_635 [Frankiales bacterium]|jgi:hypothetical protein|nr:hypothetical protein [Frankiales bacterium]
MLMAIHGAVRRDLARLAGAVGALADPGIRDHDRAVGAAGLAAYWDCLAHQLHHHHTIEDTEVFPYVRKALGDRSGAVMDKMGTEHDAIDEAQALGEAAVRALAAEPTAARASQAAERLLTFQQVVLAHLSHEEAEAIPLILEGFDEGYWQAFMGRRQQDPGGDTFLPWVLDGAPAPAVAAVTGALPPPVRELLVTEWQPAHAARVDALPSAR